MSEVRIRYHRQPVGWWAGSPDLLGFSAAGETYDEVRAMALQSVSFAIDAQPEIVKENAPIRDPR